MGLSSSDKLAPCTAVPWGHSALKTAVGLADTHHNTSVHLFFHGGCHIRVWHRAYQGQGLGVMVGKGVSCTTRFYHHRNAGGSLNLQELTQEKKYSRKSYIVATYITYVCTYIVTVHLVYTHHYRNTE